EMKRDRRIAEPFLNLAQPRRLLERQSDEDLIDGAAPDEPGQLLDTDDGLRARARRRRSASVEPVHARNPQAEAFVGRQSIEQGGSERRGADDEHVAQVVAAPARKAQPGAKDMVAEAHQQETAEPENRHDEPRQNDFAQEKQRREKK